MLEPQNQTRRFWTVSFLHQRTIGGGPMIQSFRDLAVWQKGMALTQRIYACTEAMPRSEAFGLTQQIRRAAVSIPSNIAEGKAIGGQGYRRHIKIALGSEAELQTQLELTRRLKMLSDADADDLLKCSSEVGRMLVSLLNALPKTPTER